MRVSGWLFLLQQIFGGWMLLTALCKWLHVRGRPLRTLAVSTEARSRLAPELPTIAETANLPGFDLAAWVGVMGPAGMAPEITEKLSKQINAMLARPEVVKRFTEMGAEVSPAPAAEFAQYLEHQLTVWETKVREAGIQPE